MPKAIVEELSMHTDARGWVVEPVDAPHLRVQRNVHVVVTQPGTVRGNHYHEHGTEISVVVGPALVRVREDGQARDIVVPENAAMRFTFPPRVSHAMKNNGMKALVIVAFNTSAFDRENPDLIPDRLID